MKYLYTILITLFITVIGTNAQPTFLEELAYPFKPIYEINLQKFNNNTSPIYFKSNGTKIDFDKNNGNIGKVEQDTVENTNIIEKVYSNDQVQFNIDIKLEDNEVNVKIAIFNMLGNLVKTVHDGTANSDGTYTFDATNLPNGFYLCILEGPNFRDAEKFTISR